MFSELTMEKLKIPTLRWNSQKALIASANWSHPLELRQERSPGGCVRRA